LSLLTSSDVSTRFTNMPSTRRSRPVPDQHLKAQHTPQRTEQGTHEAGNLLNQGPAVQLLCVAQAIGAPT